MFGSSSGQGQTFMPPQASIFAAQIDYLYTFLLWASLISSVLVIGGMIWFVIKYRRKTDTDKTAYISHNVFLEFLWSFIPFVIFIGVFAWGWVLYHDMRTAPEDAFEVHVVAKKWSWDFLYKSGKVSSNEMIVPVNTPIKLIMTSRDVLHSFFVPAFRVKQDVVPGRYTSLWFEANQVGEYQVFCTEFCGDQHSSMLAKVRVVTQKQFEDFLLEGDPYEGLSLTEVGEQVFSKQCAVCHNISGVKKVGPGLGGLFGQVRKFVDGSQMEAADDNYIRESILNPNKKMVEGYPPAMPTFAGVLKEKEIIAIIEYIKLLKP